MVRLARLRSVVSIVTVLCLPAITARGQTVSELVAGPPNLQMSLAPGDTAIRAVTLVNSGDTDVPFRVRVSPGSPAPAKVFTSRTRGLIEWPDARSDRRPERMRIPELSRRTAPVLQAGADVLLLQDAAPWGTTSNEQVLAANGIAYDAANSAVFPGFDLSPYSLVIVASDQPTAFYDAIAADSVAIEAWVANGGTLEFHAAGWGFQAGDASRVTLPGGMHIFPRYAPYNRVEIPGHPIVSGVPTLLTGTSASHASFSEVPIGASVIVTDDVGNPNLVEYFHGLGAVIACGQTLEFGYAAGQDPERILTNLIPYAHRDVLSWLAVEPRYGVVPAHGTLDLSMLFESGGPAGDLYASVVLQGVDADSTRLSIPVTLTVTAVPNALLLGPSRHSTSQKPYTQHSETTHHALAVHERPASQATLTLTADGDFGDISEFAQLDVEGASLGSVGGVLNDCFPATGKFPLTVALPDSVFGDGALAAGVTNSPNVDVFCAVNRHTLELHYFLRADSIRFGEVNLGSCAAETLTLRNSGNVALHVSSITCDAPFAVSPAAADLPPDSSLAIAVSMCATTEGHFMSRLSIASDDPETPLLESVLDAHGVTPAVIGVQPDSMSAALYTGATEVQELHLHNGGGATLRGTLTAVAAYSATEHPTLDYFPNAGHGTIQDVRWLRLPAGPFEVPSGGDVILPVTFDAADLGSGIHRGEIHVLSNDPLDPEHVVAARLEVTGASHIQVSPESLAFETLFLGATQTLPLAIANHGALVLHAVLSIGPVGGDPWPFTVDSTTINVAPGQERQVHVRFAPTTAGSFTPLLMIVSNDPDDPLHSVGLSGTGVESPDLSLSPDSLHVGLESGSVHDRTITIENHGGSPLAWQLSLEEAPVGPNAPARNGADRGNVPHHGPAEPASTSATAPFDPGHREFSAPAADLAGMPPWVLPASLGAGTSGRPSGPGLAAHSSSFEDDFEDGDISDWLFAGPTPFEVVTDVSSQGTHSLHQFASFGGHLSGRYHPLSPSQPERIRFDVRLANTTDAAGYVLIFDEYGNVPVLFLATPTGKLSVNLFTGQGDSTLAFTPGLWYRIELRNFDYAGRTFDYFVNGALVRAGVPLATTTPSARFTGVHLYSWSPGSQAWWDDLRIGGGHAPEWLSANTTAGSILPGEQAVVTLHFDSGGLIEGAYGARAVVETNDPTAGTDSVAVRLDVDGTQQLTLRGLRREVVSTQTYFNDGGTTVHHIPVPSNATGGADIRLIANGDFGDAVEHATLAVEGTTLGSVGAIGPDCAPASGTFGVRDSLFEAWAGADGELTAVVTNDLDVNVHCQVNQHQVTVVWHDPPDTTDFGPVFLSACRSETLEVFNSGTAVLTVTSLATDHPDFTVTPSQALLAPFQSTPVFVRYCPGTLGAAEAALTVLSDDPSQGSISVLLRGSGVPAPVMEVSPDSIVAAVAVGTILDTTITISNTGGSDLSVTVEVRGPADGDSIAVHPSRVPITAAGMPWKSPETPGEARAGRRSQPILRARPVNVIHDLPVVLGDPAGDAGYPDLVAVRAALLPDSLRFEMEFNGTVNPFDFGGAISFDLDRNALTGPPPYFGNGFQVLGSEMTVFLFDVESGVVPVYDAYGIQFLGFGSSWTAGNRLGFALPSYMLGASTNFDFAGTVGNAVSPTDFFPDAGHGSLLGTEWLSVAPETLLVPPGESREVTVTLNGNLVVAGRYEGNLHVKSDDPVHRTADIPVRVRVYGIPNLLAPSAVDFDSVVAGTTARRSIWVLNTGTDVLDVGDVSSNDFQFAATPAAFTIASGESLEVEISCVPSGTGPRSGVVTIHSNDPDDASHDIALFAIGTPPPSAAFSLESIEHTLHEGETANLPLILRNDGEGPLHWSVRVTIGDTGFVVRHVAAASPGVPHAKGAARTEPVLSAARPASPAVRVASARRTALTLPLEDVQVAIASHFDSLTTLIPSRFDFSEGESGTNISDGGFDMYDGGNQLSTELGMPLPYDSLITTHVGLPGGRYFTLKRPGLFAFVADIGAVNEFYVSGNLGADGSGQFDASELVVSHGSTAWRGFVKRVFNAGDPSVNHLIVVPDQAGLAHDYSTHTDSDFDRVSGLFGAPRLIYLLFASQNGGYVNDFVMLQIMERLIEITEKSWLSVSPEAGIVMPNDSTQLTVSLDVSGLGAGDHHGALRFDTDDPLHLVFTVPVLLHADTTVAASRSLMESSVGPGLVRLAWWSSDRSGFTARVERREEAGAWESVGEILTDGSGVARFEDRDVTAGATYHYRIHVRGEPEPDGEVIVTVPLAFQFALYGAHPNPATPDLRVAFTLPDRAPASLELLDLAGRRVVSRDVGSLGPGRHLVALGRERVLADGLYWVRLQRAGEQKIAKVVLHR